jgi:hypothetical protein
LSKSSILVLIVKFIIVAMALLITGMLDKVLVIFTILCNKEFAAFFSFALVAVPT